MKFEDITQSTDRYNFHSHTQYCDGRATMADMAQAACESGMLHYGFSPHSPIICHSTCNMKADDVENYINEADHLKEKYDGRLKIYTSMEIDYLSHEHGAHIDYFQNLPLDYRIGSVHFVPTRKGEYIDCDGRYERFKQNLNYYFQNDLRYVVEKFFEQTLMMLEHGGFDILGHFDKIGHNASCASPEIECQSWYEALIDDVISQAQSGGVTIEINTKALTQHNRIFPSELWLGKVIASGLPYIINSDAHYPDKINSGREETIEIVKKIKSQMNYI